MKFFHFLICLFLIALQTTAQQNHFVYIQTENKQPFYVKMADLLLSSSASGYLVIPKLQEGKYEIGIGFPKNEWPLQRIEITVKNDAGYVLKNFESKGWGLFNMQTMEIVKSSAPAAPKVSTADTLSDGFANVLADVVNTASIKEKPVVKESIQQKDTVVVKKVYEEPVKSIVEVKTEKPATEPVKPAIILFSSLDAGGRSVVYVDEYENKSDTIRVFIPYKSIPAVKEKAEKPAEKNIKEAPKQDVKFIDMEISNTENKAEPVADKKKEAISGETTDKKKQVAEPVKKISEPKTEPVGLVMVNSDCKAYATEADFLKLRKKMAAEKTDEDMISAARKALKLKCYHTEQISSLSSLFLNDEGRYNFFDEAYPYVSDSHNFRKLVTKLTDEYYITRFNAMIRH